MAPPSLRELGLLVDDQLLPLLYRTASVEPAEVRAELAAAGLPVLDPARPSAEQLDALERSADAVIARATLRAGVRGAIAGAAGLAAVPPELLATWVQLLRLAQRLAVVYGCNPHSARGKLLVWRAVTAAFEVSRPGQGQIGLRVRDLPALVVPGKGTTSTARAATRLLLSRALTDLGRRLGRAVPGVGAGIGAVTARRSLRQHGRRMAAVFAGTLQGARLLSGPVEDAVEVAHPQ